MPRSISRFADGLWLALLAIFILAGAGIVPFHGDESSFVVMGKDYHALLLDGDLTKILYDANTPDIKDQHRRIINGSVGSILYGWVAWNQGYGANDFNNPWRWKSDYAFNERTGRIPERQLLNGARLASAALLALAVSAIYAFVSMTLNRPTAYIASALFALHPNVLINGRRAMSEGGHLLGLTLVLLASAWLLRERKWWAYPLLGACMGFAAAGKHTNATIVALTFLAIALMTWRERRMGEAPKRGRGLKRPIWLLALPITAAIVFLLLNPAWWSAPFEVAREVVSSRSDALRDQTERLGGYQSFGEQVSGFFRYVFAAERQYFEVAQWAEYEAISAQIERYESSGLAGILIGGTVLFGIASLALAAFGAFDLARNRRLAAPDRILLFVWIAGAGFVTLAVTPLPWARYYLPLAPALVILAAHGIFIIVSSLWKRYSIKADGINLLD